MMNTIKLTNACNIVTGKLDSNAAVPDGHYPFFTCAPDPLKIDSFAFDRQAILLAGNNAAGNFHCQRYDGKFNAYQRTYVITAKQGYDIDFIYYSLLINLQLFRKIAQGSQTKFLTMEILDGFEFDNLPYIKQIALAKVLKNIDLKIANNNAICADLEAMAKQLYDYWFVQFDFPDENGKPYKSSGGKMVWNEDLKREIPEGWEVKPLGDVFSFVKGRIPDFLSNTSDEDYTSPYITIDVANNGLPQYCNPKSMVACNGEVIMVMDGAASGDVYLGNIGSLGSTFSMLPSKRDDISNALIYMLLKANMAIYKRANTGSTVPHANRSFIEKMKVCLPANVSYMSKEFNLLFNKMILSRTENQQLASLRDFLLPMLMNGQVKVQAPESAG